ncbi:MAG: molecular chaperone [Candidatus Binatia bacterium]|nr:MAG: molecular chaperone [Fimbriimonadales bacterium]GIW44862.1 MAG: molecular chaperone [Candidatus Binatia bacterium]
MARWDPWQEMEALRREIDRAFESAGLRFPSLLRSGLWPGRGERGYPPVNVYEDKDAFYIEVLAPGVDPNSVTITALRNSVTISGEKPRAVTGKTEAIHREERSSGKFSRRIELPVEVDEGKAKAEYRNGVLLVTLPKAEQAKPKAIAVQVG